MTSLSGSKERSRALDLCTRAITYFTKENPSTRCTPSGTAQSLSEQHSSEADAAAFLLGFGARLTRRGLVRNHFELPMSRQDIASYLRLAPETVSRVLSGFREWGWIGLNRREIRPLDRPVRKALSPGERRL